MSLFPTKLVVGLVLVFILNSNFVHAQENTTTLSGTVMNSAGKAAPNVKVSIKNMVTGQSSETENRPQPAITASPISLSETMKSLFYPREPSPRQQR